MSNLSGKIIVSIALVTLSVAFSRIKSNANNAGSDLFWRGGKRDPIRNLLMRSDGSLRRYTKLVVLLFFAAVLLALWVAVPTT